MNSHFTKNFFIIIIFCLPLYVFGQYRFDIWTAENGLPQNTVNGILQADDGYIWFTTNDGIVRFDGMRFKVFDKLNTKELNASRFNRSFKDKAGRLWFKSETGDWFVYQNGSFKAFTLENDLPGKGISYLNHDGRGGILFTSLDAKKHFRFADGKFLPFEVESSRPDSEICFYDSEGGIWLIDSEGLRRVVGGKVMNYGFKENFKSKAEIYEDKESNFWIGETKQPLRRVYRGELQEFALKFFYKKPHITADTKGNLWIATGKNVVKISRKAVESPVPLNEEIQILEEKDGLSFDRIISINAGREGSVWLGSITGGLIQVNSQDIKVFSGADWNSENENVYPVFEDSAENVWLGVWNKSLIKYSDGKFSIYESPKNISALFEDSEKKLWVASGDGVYILKNGNFENMNDSLGGSALKGVFTINEDREKNLWFGTNGDGLVRSKNGKAEVFTTKNGLPSDRITAFLELKDGRIAVGTRNGFAIFENGKWTTYENVYVRSLYEDKSGILWIGTYDSGLIRFDGKFHYITPENGLYSKNVFCILEDDNGWFWMNSNTGIYRVLRQELEDFTNGKINRVTSIAYTKKDGLLSAEGNGDKQPAGIKRRNGELWFPTQKGVAVINPTEVSINELPPPVHFEEVLIDGENIGKYAEEIVLQPGQESVEINYTGLSFINPELVKFRYRLAGFDEKWTEAGTRRFAFFTNLPPGEYKFELQAANRDGVWNTDGKTLRIRIVPPFYKTVWFTVLCVLAAFVLLYLGYRFRLKQIERKHRLQDAFSRKLIDSQEQERKRIAAELHDSLGQLLVIIKNRARMGLKSSEIPNETAEHLDEISDASSQAIDEVKEISFDLRPYLLDKLGLTKTIQSMLTKVFASSETELETDIENIDDVFPKDSEILFYRIVQEAASNIIKHSEAENAKISIIRTDKKVILRVADNGTGFNTEQQKSSPSHSFGLIGIGERARLLGGIFLIDSELGKETVLTVEIRLTN